MDTNPDLTALPVANEPQDLSAVGPTPYEDLFAEEGPEFIEAAKAASGVA